MSAPTLICRVPIPMTREWSTAWDDQIGLLMISSEVGEDRAKVLAKAYAAPDARWLTPETVTADLGGASAALVVADPPLLVLAHQTAPADELASQPVSPGLDRRPFGASHVSTGRDVPPRPAGADPSDRGTARTILTAVASGLTLTGLLVGGASAALAATSEPRQQPEVVTSSVYKLRDADGTHCVRVSPGPAGDLTAAGPAHRATFLGLPSISWEAC